jgi:hypothetical protein
MEILVLKLINKFKMEAYLVGNAYWLKIHALAPELNDKTVNRLIDKAIVVNYKIKFLFIYY